MTKPPLLAQAAESGCVVIDLKGICSALSDVPVVVPTINEENLTELRQRNNCEFTRSASESISFISITNRSTNKI